MLGVRFSLHLTLVWLLKQIYLGEAAPSLCVTIAYFFEALEQKGLRKLAGMNSIDTVTEAYEKI